MQTWAFPRHRPQLYAPSGRLLAAAERLYSYGRTLPASARRGISLTLHTPVARRLIANPAELDLPMDGATFEAVLETGLDLVGLRGWAVFRSSWYADRFVLLAFDHDLRCSAAIHVYPHAEVTFHPEVQGTLVRIPAIIGTRRLDDWFLRVVEPLPPRHRPHPWDPHSLTEVAGDISTLLVPALERSPGVDPGWVPVHGDLTPWNLRVGPDGQVWLIDWEWATFGPPATDLLRFAISHSSLGAADVETMYEWILASVPSEREALRDAARYWLAHRVYRTDRPRTGRTEDSAGVVAARAQAEVETSVLMRLAEDT